MLAFVLLALIGLVSADWVSDIKVYTGGGCVNSEKNITGVVGDACVRYMKFDGTKAARISCNDVMSYKRTLFANAAKVPEKCVAQVGDPVNTVPTGTCVFDGVNSWIVTCNYVVPQPTTATPPTTASVAPTRRTMAVSSADVSADVLSTAFVVLFAALGSLLWVTA